MDMFGRGVSCNRSSGKAHFASGLHQLSHDLRTPLNHINGFAELLLMDPSLSPASADYVEAILAGSKALQAAVISFLDRADAAGAPAPAPCRLAA
jgi:signal transduction histidine kinase